MSSQSLGLKPDNVTDEGVGKISDNHMTIAKISSTSKYIDSTIAMRAAALSSNEKACFCCLGLNKRVKRYLTCYCGVSVI